MKKYMYVVLVLVIALVLLVVYMTKRDILNRDAPGSEVGTTAANEVVEPVDPNSIRVP